MQDVPETQAVYFAAVSNVMAAWAAVAYDANMKITRNFMGGFFFLAAMLFLIPAIVVGLIAEKLGSLG